MFLAGAGFASQAYAGAALFIRTTVGGSASSNFNLWTWDGGLADDWKNKGVDSDRTCDLGGANDASCENNGYKGHLVNSNTNGCNNHEDVNEGTYCLLCPIRYYKFTYLSIKATLLPLVERKSTSFLTLDARPSRSAALVPLVDPTTTVTSVISRP